MTLECWQKKTTHQYINKVTKPRLELEQRVMLGPRHCRPLLLLCRRHCHVSSAQRAAGSVDGGEEPVGSAELKRKLQPPETLTVCGQTLKTDSQTNLTPRVLGLVGRDLHLQKHHPMGIIKQRIVNFMYSRYPSPSSPRSPLFSVHDRLSPLVTVEQNYDSLLVPVDHPSRRKSDAYYVNSDYMLRAHTSAHQVELIRMGLDNFLVVGDVYRRDEINSSHYPAFHQLEGVRLLDEPGANDALWRSAREKLKRENPGLAKYRGDGWGGDQRLVLFEDGVRNDYKQSCHTQDAAMTLEIDLKSCLVDLAMNLFGKDITYRWVDAYFPFTHPSWELEILFSSEDKDSWMEVLGCGIMEQELLRAAGAPKKIGWAFGLGLERLAMRLFNVPDIRLFWSKDTGFLSQFVTDDIYKNIVYKPISKFPQCVNDLSFWLPSYVDSATAAEDFTFSPNDFYDLVREVGGDLVEQVSLIDDFFHPKKQLRSHCYRIVYRSPERTLSQQEVNVLHRQIEKEAVSKLNVVIR